MSLIRYSVIFLFVVGLVTSSAAQDPTESIAKNPTPKKYNALASPVENKQFSFHRFLTKDKFGRTITFYLSKIRTESKESKLPLIVCIQGSGSQSVFMELERNGETLIGSGGPEAVAARFYRNRARVLVVEKPGVEFLVQPSRPGSAEESSAEFRREFTLERWTEAINASVNAMIKMPYIDSSKVLALGHSEGGQIACQLAAGNPAITHVASMAGGGPTQVFDFLQLARKGAMYDPAASPKQRVQAFVADWKKVLESPMSTDQFILGHPHRRWTTFSETSPIEAALRTKAKFFIAQGTKDTNSLPASAEMMYAELLARGRDCTYLRVEGGDHAFMIQGDKGAGWTETIKKAIDWFLN